MAMAKSGKVAATVLRIEGDMTIYRAAEWKSALLAPLETSTTLDVDLSAVSEIDCSGIQLLMLAKKTAQQRQCEIRMIAHNPAVVEAFDLLNLAGYFGDQIVIASGS